MEENFDGENGAQDAGEDTGTLGGMTRTVINAADPLEMNFLVELPEHVEITSIPRLNEIKQIW